MNDGLTPREWRLVRATLESIKVKFSQHNKVEKGKLLINEEITRIEMEAQEIGVRI